MDDHKENEASVYVCLSDHNEDDTLLLDGFEEYYEGFEEYVEDATSVIKDTQDASSVVPVNTLQSNTVFLKVAATGAPLLNDHFTQIECGQEDLSFKSDEKIAEEECMNRVKSGNVDNYTTFSTSSVEDSSDEDNIAIQLDFSDYECETQNINNINNLDVDTDKVKENIEYQIAASTPSAASKLTTNASNDNLLGTLQTNNLQNNDQDSVEKKNKSCNTFSEPEEPEVIRHRTPKNLSFDSDCDTSFISLQINKDCIINNEVLCSSPENIIDSTSYRYNSDSSQLNNSANLDSDISSYVGKFSQKYSKAKEKNINLPEISNSSDSEDDFKSKTAAGLMAKLRKLAQETATSVNELESQKENLKKSDKSSTSNRKKVSKKISKSIEDSSDSENSDSEDFNSSQATAKIQLSKVVRKIKEQTSHLKKEHSKNKSQITNNNHDKNVDSFKGCEQSTIEGDINEVRQSIISRFHKEGSAAIPLSKTHVPFSSEGGKYFTKKNNCVYCSVLQDRLDRHLVNNHGDESAVKVLIALPKQSKERRQHFAALRNLGNEIFNKDKALNPDGIIICSRRKRMPKKETAKKNAPADVNENENDGSAEAYDLNSKNEKEDIIRIATTKNDDKIDSTIQIKEKCNEPEKVICEYCRGYYSIRNIHNHIRLMHKKQEITNTRQILASSKKAMDHIHPRASEFVRDFLIPQLRYDEISAVIRYDLLIILYANKYGDIHEHPDQHSYVRGHMRLLGKLLLAIRAVNPKIEDLATAFRAKYWPYVLRALKTVSGYNEVKKRFNIPYNAETLPILIRKCFKILRNEYTKTEDIIKQERLTGFMNVFEDEVQGAIYTKVTLTRKENNRHKDEPTLPSSNDIATFTKYLKLKRNVSIRQFKSDLAPSYNHWLNLCQTTLALMQLFNRRRAGETGKMEVTDYLKAKVADINSEFFQQLSESEKEQRLKYKRIDIQGKKIDGKGSIYITNEDDEAIKLILEYREEFNVSSKNRFLFGLPDTTGHNFERHLSLCTVMRELSEECSKYYEKIEDSKMRGTILRYQGVTKNSSLNNNSSYFVDHMGHSERISKNYYRKTIDSQDVEVTKLLEEINIPGNKRNDLREKEVGVKKVLKRSIKRTLDCDDMSVSIDNDEENNNEDDSNTEVHSNDNEYPKINKALRKHRRVSLSNECSQQPLKSRKINEQGRRSWSAEEQESFNTAFILQLRTRSYPTMDAIRRAQILYPALQARSEKVIRTRFSNIYNKPGRK